MALKNNDIAMMVLGTSYGSIELRKLGKYFCDLKGKDIDLQVSLICESEGVYRCDCCDWWVEELVGDICEECYREGA